MEDYSEIYLCIELCIQHTVRITHNSKMNIKTGYFSMARLILQGNRRLGLTFTKALCIL